MLTSIIQNGLSGLQASQTGLRVTSQNITNADTSGYVRASVDLQQRLIGGRGAGVEIAAIQRAADRFLAAASLTASSMQTSASARAGLMDRAQSIFGDPSTDSSTFGAVNRMFSSLTSWSTDPTSAVRSSQAVNDLSALFGELRRNASDLEALRVEADQRIAGVTADINGVLSQIAELNRSVRTARINGQDATGSENAVSQLIDKLATMIDIRVSETGTGGFEVRTQSGVLLVGDRASQLKYTATGALFAATSSLQIVDGSGAARSFDGGIVGGELSGLMQARDQDIPAIAEALGGLAGALADALNAAHNDSSSVPAPAALDGRKTGLLAADALGFTGKFTLGVTDAAGALARKIDVDFDAGTLSVNGGAATSFAAAPPATTTLGAFVTALNTALTGFGGASFDANGALHLTASGGGAGLALRQDATAPSDRGGRGFSHFFGLNDVAVRASPSFYETGLTTAEAGFTGGPIVLRVRDSQGQLVVERSIAAVSSSIGGMIGAINASGTGLGPYAQLSTPDVQGRVTLAVAPGFTVEVVNDATTRGGQSFTTLFGLGAPTRAARAMELGVRSDIAATPLKLATARPDLNVALGTRVLERGDGRGLQALAAAKSASLDFAGAGPLAAQTTTLSRIVSGFAGEVGRRAAAADRDEKAATAVADAALERRTSKEGVNLDEELMTMTRYQQSYAAASRLIQAAKDMFDILLSLK